MVEGTIGDSSDDLERFLYNGHTEMISVVNQPSNVLSGHLGKLFLKDILQPCQDDHVLLCVVVVDHPKFDDSFPFFEDGRLLGVFDIFIMARSDVKGFVDEGSVCIMIL